TVKISGKETFNATPEEIYAFVTDPERGAACSAAVEELTSQSGGKFTVKVAYRKGAFNPSGTVDGAFSNLVKDKSGRLSGTGIAIGGGRLEHRLEFMLATVPGIQATDASYTAEVVFKGALGGFSQKFLEKQVNTVASKFVLCARKTNGW
ncbi:MAG: CoxG family protein, partial [Thermomicrobiales bacterium]